MKFSQFMSYYKRKKLSKFFLQKLPLKTSSRPFCVCKGLSTTSIEKWNFWNKLLTLECKSKTIKICPNQDADLLRFLFKGYLWYKTIFCSKVAVHVKLMNFFIWRKNNVSFSRFLAFCVFVKSTDFKICVVIISIAM